MTWDPPKDRTTTDQPHHKNHGTFDKLPDERGILASLHSPNLPNKAVTVSVELDTGPTEIFFRQMSSDDSGRTLYRGQRQIDATTWQEINLLWDSNRQTGVYAKDSSGLEFTKARNDNEPMRCGEDTRCWSPPRSDARRVTDADIESANR